MRKDPYGLTELLKPSIESMGFDLWGIEFHANTKNAILRIFIDHSEGIAVDNCADVSHQVAGLLDVHDPISTHYTLEVSSPGLDRAFFTVDQFKNYINASIKFQLHTALEGKRRFEAVLEAVNEDSLIVTIPLKNSPKQKTAKPLEDTNERLTIPFQLIDKANLSPTFTFDQTP